MKSYKYYYNNEFNCKLFKKKKKKKKKKHLYDEASTILLYLKYDFIKNIIL